jgi:heavy metal translocating P-type ATPase
MSSTGACCDLCGLPLRHGIHSFAVPKSEYRFCCRGCRQVFRILLEANDGGDPAHFQESALFKQCREMGIIPRSEADLAEPSDRPLASDHPERPGAVSANPTTGDDPGSLALNLKIDNMWCPACAWVIDETLARMPGILLARCNFSTDRLFCRFDPVKTSHIQIAARLKDLGYNAFMPEEGAGSKQIRGELIRLAVSALLTMNVMMLSFALYSGFFVDLSRDTILKLSWPIFIMATIVLLYGGWPIYRRAMAGISTAGFSMETLITTGALSAFGFSTFNLLSGSIHLYYDTASMLITLVLIGKYLERKARGEIQGDLEYFFSLRPNKVKICSERFPQGRYVSVKQLERDDLFQVDEGEVVPADGTITAGEGLTDESSLTGEARPVAKRAGEHLRSGTRISQGIFKVRAEAVGGESTLGQMIQIMEKALAAKTSIESTTDRVLQWFVPIILLLALGTGLANLLITFDLDRALIRAVTVMVIACPCTLGVAVPLARVAGISLAAKKGILVRDFASFERVGRVNTFVFDKTGTLTEGDWKLLDVVPWVSKKEEELLSLAASLEASSNHHIAFEIKRAAQAKGVQPLKLERIRIFQNGVSGWHGRDEVKIGSRDFLRKEFSSWDPGELTQAAAAGSYESLVFMSYAGRPCALLRFGDRIRAGAELTMEALRLMGHQTILISGDGISATKAVSKTLGIISALGGQLPQEKALFIKQLQERGAQVAMVGDGINDAPALMQADLSMAVYSGGHLGREAADVTLMRGDPSQALDFKALAASVTRKVRQNLGCSFIYNVVSIPVAMSGLLTPLIAVSAMLLSSLSVIGNTLLLTRHRSKAPFGSQP